MHPRLTALDQAKCLTYTMRTCCLQSTNFALGWWGPSSALQDHDRGAAGGRESTEGLRSTSSRQAEYPLKRKGTSGRSDIYCSQLVFSSAIYCNIDAHRFVARYEDLLLSFVILSCAAAFGNRIFEISGSP